MTMRLLQRQATGLEYLDLVTDLLQQIRLDSAEGGLWEAADLQWAWRRDQHADPNNATFWMDADHNPVAAVVVTNYGDRVGFDVITRQQVLDHLPTMWDAALNILTKIPDAALATAVRDDDKATIALALGAGFVADDDIAVSCWLDAADRPQISDLVPGYRLRSRADLPTSPHHMIKRNGEHVAERLRECSLYNPSFDLFVEASDGSVAAYGLFWPDPVTGVGLVEPMRTEDEHQGRGLARHILSSGVERLAAASCARMRVTYMDDNPVSGHLYRSAGFGRASLTRSYRRSPL